MPTQPTPSRTYQPGMTNTQKAAVDAAAAALDKFLAAMDTATTLLSGSNVGIDAERYADENVEEAYLSDGMVYDSVQRSVAVLDYLLGTAPPPSLQDATEQ